MRIPALLAISLAAATSLPAAADDAARRSSLPPVLAQLQSQLLTDRLGNGCWLRLYEDAHFRGASVTLVGPADLARIRLHGREWADWDSAVVGPQARVAVFDDRNLRDRSARLHAGERIADLHGDKLGWTEQIRSARVQCAT